jgi:ketol-acid reductoisomerase
MAAIFKTGFGNQDLTRILFRKESMTTKTSKITVLGYGSQGRAIALNLRDSGYDITVALRAGSPSVKKAKRDKIKVVGVSAAIRDADIIFVAIPDHQHKAVLNVAFFSGLKKSPALIFLSGASIHFGLVKPPKQLPLLLLAPHAPGSAVRGNYIAGKPFSAFYAVHQGPRKVGTDILFRLAKGIGIPKTHLVKTTFADEAIGDIFGEQAVLCGALARLMKLGFESLVEAGLPPENAYLEVANQIDLIVALVKTHGLAGMFDRISPLARYGSALNGPRIIDDTVKRRMKQVLAEIKSGKFIRDAEKSNVKVTNKQMSLLVNRLFDRQVKKYSKNS